jgi:hypothetical protein
MSIIKIYDSSVFGFGSGLLFVKNIHCGDYLA